MFQRELEELSLSFLLNSFATGTHVPYGITRCYLPPGRGDIYRSRLKLVLYLAISEGCKAVSRATLSEQLLLPFLSYPPHFSVKRPSLPWLWQPIVVREPNHGHTGGPTHLARFFVCPSVCLRSKSKTTNINRFSKLFHCQNQAKILNNTVIKDPTTPEVCCYTTLWNVTEWSRQTVAAFHWSQHWWVASPAWMRRPAEMWTNWTFDVKIADVTVTLDCFSIPVFLKYVAIEVLLFSVCI